MLKFPTTGREIGDAKSGDIITIIVKGTLIDGTTNFWGTSEVKVIIH